MNTGTTCHTAFLIPLLWLCSDAHGMPERVIPPLSDILAASAQLADGDIPLDASTAAGKTPLYVATNGDNGNSGLSPDTPKRDLGAAIEYANANPGTPFVIYLRGGTHYRRPADEYLEIERGNLLITAYPGDEAVIRPHFWPNNPDYWGQEVFLYSFGPHEDIAISNLTLQGWGTPFVFGATFDVPPLRNIVIRNIRAEEFRVRGTGFKSIFFSTNYIDADYFSGREFDPYDPGIKYQIEGLTLSGISLRGVDAPIDIGDENDANVKGLRISNVEVRNPPQQSGGSGVDGFAVVNCHKVLIDDCLIDNIMDDGIDAKSFDVCVVNTLVRGTGRNAVKFWHGGELINSVIYDCTKIDDGALIVVGGPCRMVNSALVKKSIGYAGTYNINGAFPGMLEIVNSVFTDLDHAFFAGTADLRSRNSLYDDMPGGLFSGLCAAADAGELNALPNCSGNIGGDPIFTDPPGEDFTPGVNSPCRDAGAAADTILPSFDYLGNVRPWGAGDDIGPIEYGSLPPPSSLNYLNLAVSPTAVDPGGAVRISYLVNFSDYDFRGFVVDVYLAVVRNGRIADSPSSVEGALEGDAVYFFGRNMGRVYRYTGSVREPTFSAVAFPPARVSGEISLRAPGSAALAGDYAFAAAILLHRTGAFIRTDGLPVEVSNRVTLR